MNTNWEHKVLTFKMGWKGFPYSQIEADVNQLGQDGWEWCSPCSPAQAMGRYSKSLSSSNVPRGPDTEDPRPWDGSDASSSDRRSQRSSHSVLQAAYLASDYGPQDSRR